MSHRQMDPRVLKVFILLLLRGGAVRAEKMGMDTENVQLSPQEANFLLGERFKKNPFLWFKDGFFFLCRSKV